MNKRTLIIKRKPRNALTENDVTPEHVFRQRRQILKALGIGGLGASLASSPVMAQGFLEKLLGQGQQNDASVPRGKYPLEYKNLQDPKPDWELTPELKAITYNNFYEFGSGKTDPSTRGKNFKVEPWTVEISGE